MRYHFTFVASEPAPCRSCRKLDADPRLRDSGGMLAWQWIAPRFSAVKNVNTVEATQLINRQNALLLDVREPKDLEGGQVPRRSTSRSRSCPAGSANSPSTWRDRSSRTARSGAAAGWRRARLRRPDSRRSTAWTAALPHGRRTGCRWRSRWPTARPRSRCTRRGSARTASGGAT